MDPRPSHKVVGTVQPKATPATKCRCRLLASPPLATPAPGRRPGQLRRTKTKRPDQQPELLGGDARPELDALEISRIIDAVPLDPALCRTDTYRCCACNRDIAAGETLWTASPKAQLPMIFCYECGVGIGLELGHHPDIDILTIPAYGGGPRRTA